MFLNVFIPVISALAAIVAAYMAIQQARISRHTAAADMLFRMEERFDNPEFIAIRQAAATTLIANIKLTENDNVENVFDFFETLGLMTHKGILDKELVWSSFFYWIHGYFKIAGNFVDGQKQKYPTRYTEAFWLCKTVDEIEKSKAGIRENEWDDFLREEHDLE